MAQSTHHSVFQAVQAQDVHLQARDGDSDWLLRIGRYAPRRINERDEGGNTPLKYAAQFGQTRAVLVLIRLRGDLNAANKVVSLCYCTYMREDLV